MSGVRLECLVIATLVFSFGLCSGKDKDAQVTRFGVVRDGGESGGRDVCGVISLNEKSLGRVWRYGERRGDVAVHKCDPLPAGNYIASATALNERNKPGMRTFTIGDDGSISQRSSSCQSRRTFEPLWHVGE
jgi:hypothetical protein